MITVFVVDAAALGAIDVVNGVEDEVAQFQDCGHHPENVGDLLRRETHRLQRFLSPIPIKSSHIFFFFLLF